MNIGVIGSGTMGNGIAHVFALSEISNKVFLRNFSIRCPISHNPVSG